MTTWGSRIWTHICLTPERLFIKPVLPSKVEARGWAWKSCSENRRISTHSPCLNRPLVWTWKTKEDWPSRGDGYCSLAFHQLFSNLPYPVRPASFPWLITRQAVSCRPNIHITCLFVPLIQWSLIEKIYGTPTLLRKHAPDVEWSLLTL